MLKTVIGASKYGNAAFVYLEKINPKKSETKTSEELILIFFKKLFLVIFKLSLSYLFFLFHIAEPTTDIAIKNNCRNDSKNSCV